MSAPRRVFTGDRLVLATHNPGKAAEFRELFAPLGVTLVTAGELGLVEPEETGATFLENARLKALAAARGSGLPALADDSGLLVLGLDGAPGVHSARWAGPERDFGRAMARIIAELARRHGSFAAADRRAAFVCGLCLAWPDGHLECFEGRIEGQIVPAPRGTQGFGYDPIFLPEGGTRTFGEMAPGEKHGISHRARAWRGMVEGCIRPA